MSREQGNKPEGPDFIGGEFKDRAISTQHGFDKGEESERPRDRFEQGLELAEQARDEARAREQEALLEALEKAKGKAETLNRASDQPHAMDPFEK